MESRYKGIREEGQILVSQSGHFVKQTCSDWIGLGMNNIREIPVDEHNRMDIPSLKKVMTECKNEGRPIVMIVCTMGTTDAFAIDSISEVRKLKTSHLKDHQPGRAGCKNCCSLSIRLNNHLRHQD